MLTTRGTESAKTATILVARGPSSALRWVTRPGPLIASCLVMGGSALVACKRSPDRHGAEPVEPGRASPDGEGQPVGASAAAVQPARCTPFAGAPALAVGARAARAPTADPEEEEEESPLSRGAVEFARGAADGAVFLLGLLHQKDEAHALVAVVEAGSARLLDLGRVGQEAEPPRVAGRGGHWLALVTDVGPSGASLRLVGLSKTGTEIETRLGPEVRKGKSDPPDADVAVLPTGQGLVVWDREAARGRSEIVGLAVDARSLREAGAPVVLTPSDQVALEPRLVAGPSSYWLLWLVEEPSTSTVPPDAGLLLEPPRLLFVRELDLAGRPRGMPIALNPGRPAPLVLDARVLPSGQLFVAHRSAPADRPLDDQPIEVSTVAPGGAVMRYPLDVPELGGPGAPTVLGSAETDVSWLTLEDANGTTGLARVLADGSVRTVPVTGLGGRVALAGEPGRLLTAEPRGIGVELQVQTCAVD